MNLFQIIVNTISKDTIIKNLLSILLCFSLCLSTLFSQEVVIWVEDVVTGSVGLQDGEAEVKIFITTSVPIYSYSFTLEGFDNVLSSNSTNILPDCMAWSYFGADNINVLDDYFYGGGIGGDVIPITSEGEFLSVVATYNTMLDDADPYFLTFNEVIPGVNGQGTNFFTYNEETQTPELVEHIWIPRTWEIGGNQTYDYIGQDCAGEIWGLANWDDCALCTGGNTNFEYNYYLDCAGECFGDSESDSFGGCCEPDFPLWWIDTDDDGYGENFGATFEECDALGGDFNDGLCTALACYRPDGFADNDLDYDLDCDGVLDDCQVCEGNSVCEGSVNDGLCDSLTNWEMDGSAFDCTGLCGGVIVQLDWYSDCDFDGLADNQNYESVCGMPTEGDITYETLCPGGGNIISIDPNNHTFDPHPDCTSNQVDFCGTCDGVGPDCRETCDPESPLSELANCTQDNYGWGPEYNLTINPLTESAAQDSVVFIIEGCRPYIGYNSDFSYAHDNGIDVCGQCYVGNLNEGMAQYHTNYSCSGCTDIHADNSDPDALFDDGSCYFQLYSGDVNRDGFVDEIDLDGIAQFWNYYTDNERDGASILWFPQFAQDDYWYDPLGDQSSSSCAMFADADGDAIVNSGDISAVLLNWGKQVSDNYYYPWGENGDAPDCLSNDTDLFRDNYEQIYNYIMDNYPYNSENQQAIEYLADLLDIEVDSEFIPDNFKVYQNYPNPFNPTTQFPIDLVKEATVTLRIFNISGKLVHEYKITDMQPGIYGQDTPFYWNSSGNPSGVYIYSFELSTGEVEFNKLMLIK